MKVFENGCGVIVECNGKILFGKRSDGQGWGLAGGKAEEGETPVQTACRELEEEFGIAVNTVSPLFTVFAIASVKGEKCYVNSKIFLHKCQEEMMPTPNREMLDFVWLDIEDALVNYDLFPPSYQAMLRYKQLQLQ